MSKTTLLLVRHGQSLGNAQRILLGHTDWDLSGLGYEQAEVCAAALAERKIDAVYSSDLIRAYHTALPHARRRGIEVIKRRELREVYLGEWECRSVTDISENEPDEYYIAWKQHFATFRPRGGESTPELAERIFGALSAVAEENVGKTVLVAFHAAAIRSFYSKISGYTEDETNATLFPANASYTVVEYENGHFTPVAYSVGDYLEQNG